MKPLQPGTVRAIEYEVVFSSQAARMGFMGANEDPQGQVAVLRCVNDRGEKLTAFGDPEHLIALLASGEIRDPAGMRLTRPGFQFVARGWVKAHELVTADATSSELG
jgi:hypothetical protein